MISCSLEVLVRAFCPLTGKVGSVSFQMGYKVDVMVHGIELRPRAALEGLIQDNFPVLSLPLLESDSLH